MRSFLIIPLLSVSLILSGPGDTKALSSDAVLAAFAITGDSTGLFSMEEEILGFVNDHRAEMGLSRLTMNETESGLAARHSANMASGKTGFGHGGFNGRAKAIQKAIPTTTSVAENVAEGQMTAREVVDGWLHSPGHKKNIEGNFTLTGIGYARDKKGNIYFTQLFSR